MKEIKITPSGIKKAIDDLLNENELLQDKLYKQEEEIERLSKKSEILEENNKLLIQQKSQLYKDLDIAYERIEEAIDFLKKRIEEVEEENEEWSSYVEMKDEDYILEQKEILNILKGSDKE